ncbi:MAG: hypothetical protein PHQ18_01710, partial [Patescibacteria group bacterium]|nr:hypothetical protein [Patescibacteria group bacterium]
MKTVLSKILFVTIVTILSLSAFDFANAETTSTTDNISTSSSTTNDGLGTSSNTNSNINNTENSTTAQLKITASTTTPFINTTTTLNILFENLENSTTTWDISSSTTFFINDKEMFDEDGIYELEITTTTPYTIYAKKDGFLNSELITITPMLSE